MLFAVAFCLALAVIALAPDTSAARWLRHALINVPAEALDRATPLKLLVGLLTIVCFVAFAIGAPEMVALFGAGELATFLDLTILAFLLGAGAKIKLAAERIGMIARLVARRATTRTRRRARRPRVRKTKSRSDGEPSWAPTCA